MEVRRAAAWQFKAYEYQSVILPIIVIRRLECVLLDWRAARKAEIREKQPKRTEKELEDLVKKLEMNRFCRRSRTRRGGR